MQPEVRELLNRARARLADPAHYCRGVCGTWAADRPRCALNTLSDLVGGPSDTYSAAFAALNGAAKQMGYADACDVENKGFAAAQCSDASHESCLSMFDLALKEKYP